MNATKIGPSGDFACPKCQNSMDNANISGNKRHLRRCASCKTVFEINEKKQDIEVGKRYVGIMPHSEVCLHMRIADRPMELELLPSGRMVQLFVGNAPYSIPITYGEAGLYHEGSVRDFNAGKGFYHYGIDLTPC
jgi:hypothetical protein